MAESYPDLVGAVNAATEAMPWLTDSDQATVDLALSYAEAIDEGLARGGQDATKALYLGPHLLKALQALGGTPLERRAIEQALNGEGGGGKLGKLRDEVAAQRAKRGTAG